MDPATMQLIMSLIGSKMSMGGKGRPKSKPQVPYKASKDTDFMKFLRKVEQFQGQNPLQRIMSMM